MRTDVLNQPRPLHLLVSDDAKIRELLSKVRVREGFEVLEVLRAVRASGSSSQVALVSGAATADDEPAGPPPTLRGAVGGNKLLALYRLIDRSSALEVARG